MLKEVASYKGSNISELSREIIMEAMREEKWQGGKDPILDDLRKILSDHMKQIDARFGRLLARTAIDSGTSRRLLVHLLVQSEINTQEDAEDIEEEAYDMAKRSLHNPLEAIDSFLKSNKAG